MQYMLGWSNALLQPHLCVLPVQALTPLRKIISLSGIFNGIKSQTAAASAPDPFFMYQQCEVGSSTTALVSKEFVHAVI